MNESATEHLARSDPVMRRLVESVGPSRLRPDRRRSPFESLVCAVANQQLHARAAQTILQRFRARFPGRRFPHPSDLASISDQDLRACGFSRAKVAAIRDIAERTLTGAIPSSRRITRMSDEAIIGCLTEARGVGRWTVEMLLIFQLGRPDVLPVDDFGVRSGFRRAYGLPELPRPRVLAEYGERWRPHRSTAAWYLWRAADIRAPAI